MAENGNGNRAKIRLNHLRQIYYIRNQQTKRLEEFVALDDFSLSIAEGEFIAIVGPSGCGKSTLLDIVAGLARSKGGGAIEIDGYVVTKPSLDRGFIMQGYALFPWRNVLRNVEYGLEVKGIPRKQRAEVARKYINLVELSGFEERFPNELSGGMRQRVAIARALAYDPVVLLMDEPFAAVDAQTRETMQDELLDIQGKANKTVIFVTHSIEEAVLLADRVVVMTPRPGRIRQIIDVTLPRPRTNADMRASADYGVLVRRIWELLHDVELVGRGEGAAVSGNDVADEIDLSAVL
ncbi:MAG: ABC transporter ATP-binding protein [Clostridiales Family XIII bacterium]|jgi:NitT/TauT family transport system ATP-binding protein|nr:ABC transporter ATP-binding protein [Clostridiales Family XIII bacterium]